MGAARKKINILKNVLNGSIKVCEFGLTNCCSCRCSFCSIWKQKPKVFVDYNKACKAIDKLAEFGVSHITLTGGEPLLHPQIVKIVQYCTKKNIHSAVLNADARLVNENNLKLLKNAGLDLISISVDSHDPKIIEESRKIPNLLVHIDNAVKKAKRCKLRTMASVVIWEGNHKNLRPLMDKIDSMGFDQISINYPEISNSKVYTLGGESVNMDKEDVINSLKYVITLKKEGYKIINITSSLKNIISYLRNPKKVKYSCYGGYKVFFLDWFFNLYPCMHLAKPIGSLWDVEKKDLKRVKCNSCNMSWYRDFSVYFHGLKSIKPFYETVNEYFGFKV